MLSASHVVSNSVSVNGCSVGGGILNFGALVVADSEVSYNRLDGPYCGQGGGILNRGGVVTITSSAINYNQSGYDSVGTGLSNINGRMSIDNSSITGNFYNTPYGYGEGGGIQNGNAYLTINNTRIVSNTTRNYGGGMYNAGSSVVTITNSLIQGNQALLLGHGVMNDRGAVLALINVTFENNNFANSGNGLGPAYASLLNVTVAGDGSEFTNWDGIVTMKNTLMAGNQPNNCYYSFVSLGHNLDSGNSCGFNATGDISNTAPLLGPLQDNGGPTPTHALLPGSPAINAGANSNCPLTDERGITRPQAGVCDIGAYEYLFTDRTFLSLITR